MSILPPSKVAYRQYVCILNLKEMNTLNTTETAVKMVLDRWYGSIKNCNSILDSLTDEQLNKEIAPNKNRGIYLLGSFDCCAR